MKGIILTLLVIGITMILVGFHKKNLKCPPPKVIYKFIPRTFEEEQENPPQVTRIFDKMFKSPNIRTP